LAFVIAKRAAVGRVAAEWPIKTLGFERRAGTAVFFGGLLVVNEPLPILVESAIQIAWDYLERSGELGEPGEASPRLLGERWCARESGAG